MRTNLPPAISSNGELRLGIKSDLLSCIERLSPPTNLLPNVDALVIDGAALVQMLHPQQCKTFDDYAMNVFIPYLSKQLVTVRRMDLVWDRYLPCSLKALTRSTRGSGIRRRVMPSVCLPKIWSQFLQVDENKTDLFTFLSERVVSVLANSDKQIVVTQGESVLACGLTELCLNTLQPCSHEEADTRLLLHIAHAASLGFTKLMIRM